MGCGQSSLKGDDVPNVNSQPVTTSAAGGGQPLKKVKTNFSSVDYDQDAQKRRMTEYAPHETPAPIREESRDLSAAGQQPHNDDIAPDFKAGSSAAYPHEGAGPAASAIDGEPSTTLKPYQTNDGGDWDNDTTAKNSQQPYLNGTQDPIDPTSNQAKDTFASANDPANALNQQSHHQTTHARPGATEHDNLTNIDDEQNQNFYTPNPDVDDQNPDKKSWLGQKYSSFQTAKNGPGVSDEDVKKYTGKDRDELNEWARDRPGVGGNQGAGRVDSDSGLVAGASWNS